MQDEGLWSSTFVLAQGDNDTSGSARSEASQLAICINNFDYHTHVCVSVCVCKNIVVYIYIYVYTRVLVVGFFFIYRKSIILETSSL